MTVLDKGTADRVYCRQLPGGGFVAIEIKAVRTLFGQRRYRGEVVVEQRVEVERRRGHVAPAVASAERETVAAVIHELFPVAQSNTLLASSVLTHRRDSQAK